MPLEFFINNNKNVKTKNNMNNFSLVIQATYTSVEYALYNNKKVCAQHSLIKTSVCTDLMFNLCALLKEHDINWPDIKHIIINQGPAPFTTLRGLIATVNGISFAQKIPLIAVDGLEAFTNEVSRDYDHFLIVLNAFAGDFYYSFKGSFDQKGCGKLSTLHDLIRSFHSLKKSLVIVGNGIRLVQEELEKEYGNKIVFNTLYDYVSLHTIAQEGFKIIAQQPITTLSVSPLYLKTTAYQPSCLV